MSSNNPRIKLSAGLTCLCLALAGAGCGSLKGPGSASFASVKIEHHSQEEIIAATSKVFTEDGYTGGLRGPNKMVFEREASRATTISKEGFYGAQSGARVVNRVRVEIVSLGGGSSYRLQCQAYIVRDAGALLEDEVRLSNLRSAPYQRLLDKVKKQLR
jgi:hypothetical protein